MRHRFAQVFFLLIGVFLNAGLLSEMLLYSENTLIRDGNWSVTKRAQAVGIMGADEYLITRMPLAGNKLDLGAWYGYQDVRLKGARALKEIKFKFKIPENSYLDIIVEEKDNGFSGIRLSRAADYASIYFLSDNEGRFLSTQPIALSEIGSGWHNAALRFEETGLSLEIDGARPLVIASARMPTGALGFRGGLPGAIIDDVFTKSANGETFSDSFRNGKNWWRLTALHFMALSAFVVSVLLLLILLARLPEAAVFNRSLVIAAQALVCLSLLYAFDFFYWSKLPFQMEMRQLRSGKHVPQMSIEEYRFGFFKSWNRLVSEEINLARETYRLYPKPRVSHGPIFCGSNGQACFKTSVDQINAEEKKCVRFLLMGTSQSIGAGAGQLEETFFVRLHRGLSSSLAGRCVESLNLSISGSNLEELTESFQQHLDFRPTIIVFNLSNNDYEPLFYDRLTKAVAAARQVHPEMIFVAEPNSADQEISIVLLRKHGLMKRAAQDLGIEMFSLHEFLGKKEIFTSGQVWWDYVHLSSYGHALVAEWLLPKMLAVIRNGNRAQQP